MNIYVMDLFSLIHTAFENIYDIILPVEIIMILNRQINTRRNRANTWGWTMLSQCCRQFIPLSKE